MKEEKSYPTYDYTGPYAGFKGAVKFAKEMVAGLYTLFGNLFNLYGN
jgi:nitrogenase molybdenum-iron protein alpha/beta subunit